MRYLFKFLLILLLASSIAVKLAYQYLIVTPVIITDNIILEIEKGDSLNQIIAKLNAKNLDISPLLFKLWLTVYGLAKQLKTGEYELNIGLTLPQLIQVLVEGKSKQHSITFIEGWRFNDVLKALASNPHLEHQFIDSANLLKQLNSEFAHPEGLFFPDTYFFTKHTSDIAVLKRAYQKMQMVLAREWAERDLTSVLPTPYSALILASIIEKETAKAEERPLIAGVFSQRLQLNMLLQTDPTVIYGMGEQYHGNISKQDLLTPTAYNTYTNKGLPPTPIALPSRASIHSALHPAKHDYLYFVAQGDGSHHFSANLEQHQQAVTEFQIPQTIAIKPTKKALKRFYKKFKHKKRR